jgi:2,3-bisphosphoglycerate-dependent phosphoglycerate mutase
LETSGRGGAVLVVAHGNSLRALRKHIDRISDDDIVGLDVPTGIPFRYSLNEDLTVAASAYLGDPEAAQAAADAVARQAG